MARYGIPPLDPAVWEEWKNETLAGVSLPLGASGTWAEPCIIAKNGYYLLLWLLQVTDCLVVYIEFWD